MIGGRTRIVWPKAAGAGGGCAPFCAEREAGTTSIIQSEKEVHCSTVKKQNKMATGSVLKSFYAFAPVAAV
jgi:hypothetical protein